MSYVSVHSCWEENIIWSAKQLPFYHETFTELQNTIWMFHSCDCFLANLWIYCPRHKCFREVKMDLMSHCSGLWLLLAVTTSGANKLSKGRKCKSLYVIKNNETTIESDDNWKRDDNINRIIKRISWKWIIPFDHKCKYTKVDWGQLGDYYFFFSESQE